MFTSTRRGRHLFEGEEQRRAASWAVRGARWQRLRQGLQGLLLALGSDALGGCAMATQRGDGLLDQALGVMGLQWSSVAAADDPAGPRSSPSAKVTKSVTMRVHAGQVLNLSAAGASLPVVLRLYKLKNRTAFDQLPYAAFSRAQAGDLGNPSADVVETRELVFLPGQRHEMVESLEPHVRFIAVVALFRAPSPQRWRAVFDAQSAAASDITLGLHGCALSVATGQALDMPPELMRVAGVRCDGGPE